MRKPSRNTNPAGSRKPRLFTSKRVELDQATYVIGVAIDIAARREAEERVQHEKLLSDTIIDTLPGIFYLFDDQADFWTPVNWTHTEMQSTQYNMGVAARLKPDVEVKQAQAEMDALAAQLAASDPTRNKNLGAVVQTMTDSLYGQLRSPLLLLQGAVGIVLLIGCANVAGLLLARAASRRTEIAVRCGEQARGEG